MEDKIIDQIIEILNLMNSYTPTTVAPASPLLPTIRVKVTKLQIERLSSKQKFQANLINIAEITKEINSIKLNA